MRNSRAASCGGFDGARLCDCSDAISGVLAFDAEALAVGSVTPEAVFVAEAVVFATGLALAIKNGTAAFFVAGDAISPAVAVGAKAGEDPRRDETSCADATFVAACACDGDVEPVAA